MTVSDALLLASEGGIPTSNPWSQLALPLGILIFVGTVYMLIRSNLGTRRGYLVMGTSLWGFAFLLSLLWAFGAPGTPANTGPQNLPGQELNEYQPIFVPFAADSAIATDPETPYTGVADYPNGWEPVPADFAAKANLGVQNIESFFAGLEGAGDYFNVLDGTEEPLGDPLYREADNGRPMIGVTLVTTCQFGLADAEADALPAFCSDEGLEVGAPIPEGAVDADGNELRQETTFFALYDGGAPYFPSLLMAGILLVLFAGHMVLLARDERRERIEAQAVAEEDVEVERRDTVGV
ncbi:MAG: hypothetical protein ACR2HR_00600 [Euzebya sp.]